MEGMYTKTASKSPLWGNLDAVTAMSVTANYFEIYCGLMELLFFSRTSQCRYRRLATLNDGSDIIKVTGAHFLLM